MYNYSDRAAGLHSRGYNCAQAVFLTFCQDLDMDPSLAARLTNCLGGGFAETGGICGAVSGACLALSAKYGRSDDSREGESLARQQKTFGLVQKLHEDFAAEFGCVDCPGLKARGKEQSPQGDNDKFLCPQYVRWAAQWTGQAMNP